MILTMLFASAACQITLEFILMAVLMRWYRNEE